MRRACFHTAVACLAGSLLLASAAAGTTITIVNLDGAGEGLNDSTAVSPVGGNTGTTRGAQRLMALQYAAGILAAVVNSAVEIKVDANFDPIFCNMSGATLGFAGTNSVHKDFAGAPVASTWYGQALANSLAGVDLSAGTNDIGATFNSDWDTTCPNSSGFYYGLDANPGSQIDFVTVALHELTHGLGFASFVDDATGAKFLGFDDAFMRLLEDHSLASLWPPMSDAQRAASAIDTGDLHWTGATAVAGSGNLTAGRHTASGHVQMYAPSPLEPGSSVSHWDTAVAPDEVMEPTYTSANHDIGLAARVFDDLAWSVNFCGDGAITGGEACDDGDNTSGDGCSATCQIETCWTCSGAPSVCSPDNGAGCNDGNSCTSGDVCSGGSCSGTTITSCIDGDGCCPGACNPGNDTDCVAAIPALTPAGVLLLAALLALATAWALRRRAVEQAR